MKLSEIKNEEALDVLADIIEPASEIFSDSDVREIFSKGGTKSELISKCIRKHKSAILKILAGIERVPFDEYEVNVVTLPLKVLELFNDDDLLSFFQSAGLNMGNE